MNPAKAQPRACLPPADEISGVSEERGEGERAERERQSERERSEYKKKSGAAGILKVDRRSRSIASFLPASRHPPAEKLNA
jgi:hypothetical protein